MTAMKPTRVALFLLAFFSLCLAAEERSFDPELAKKLGADERGMKMYVLCILKTGPKDAEITGEARKEIFAGHFANIGRLADEGKLAVAGPFGKNDKAYRGLYVFNVATIESKRADQGWLSPFAERQGKVHPNRGRESRREAPQGDCTLTQAPNRTCAR